MEARTCVGEESYILYLKLKKTTVLSLFSGTSCDFLSYLLAVQCDKPPNLYA